MHALDTLCRIGCVSDGFSFARLWEIENQKRLDEKKRAEENEKNQARTSSWSCLFVTADVGPGFARGTRNEKRCKQLCIHLLGLRTLHVFV